MFQLFQRPTCPLLRDSSVLILCNLFLIDYKDTGIPKTIQSPNLGIFYVSGVLLVLLKPNYPRFVFEYLFHDYAILGGSNLYRTGVNIRDSSRELINPPTITNANGLYNGDPCIINGIILATAVMVVKNIGINRTSPAVATAVSNGIPSLRR